MHCSPLIYQNDSHQEGYELGRNVMLVDDDPDFLGLLGSALGGYGLKVKECENAVEALLGSMGEKFDYIITDYEMPGINGLELAQRLREKFPYLVIIGMSATNIEEKFLRIGANDFLQSPISPRRLAMMITGNDITI